MKKIAVKGRGTAGALGVTHFLRWTDCEIDWYYDPSKPTQAVGESTNLLFPRALYSNIGFHYSDIQKINGSYKRSVYKKGWGKKVFEFEHPFPPPTISCHVDCLAFQDYVLDFVKDNPRINSVPENRTNDSIDADYILDCSGRPTEYDEFHISEFIPVNSTHVIQCYWDQPTFDYTLTIARPHGWVFGIPLQNRCSFGYLYNKDISTLEEVQEDLLKIIEEHGQTPSKDNITFSFKNYYRKQNFNDRIVYNGNASFFLEPMEATSIGMMIKNQQMAFDYWFNNISQEDCQKQYLRHLNNTEHFLGMHYASGSIYDSPFWDFAQPQGLRCMERAVKNEEFMFFYENSKKYINNHDGYIPDYDGFSFWWMGSFKQILSNLDMYNTIEKIKGE